MTVKKLSKWKWKLFWKKNTAWPQGFDSRGLPDHCWTTFLIRSLTYLELLGIVFNFILCVCEAEDIVLGGTWAWFMRNPEVDAHNLPQFLFICLFVFEAGSPEPGAQRFYYNGCCWDWPKNAPVPILQLQDKKSMVSCLTSFQVSVHMLMSAIFYLNLELYHICVCLKKTNPTIAQY